MESHALRTVQKDRLFGLLKLKTMNEGLEIKGLADMIAGAKVRMDEADVAWVEKMLGELKA